jgi:cobalamin biosynthesis Mg chelatase CobN
MRRGTSFVGILSAVVIVTGMLVLSLFAAPSARVQASDPTLDAAEEIIRSRTRAMEQTRAANEATAAAQRQTATALDLEQKRIAVEQTRAAATRQAQDIQAIRQAQQDATATAYARVAATAQAEQTATAHARATATAQAEQTVTAQVRATATAQAEQTATAQARAAATAQAEQTATAQARAAEVVRQRDAFIRQTTTIIAIVAGALIAILFALAVARAVWLIQPRARVEIVEGSAAEVRSVHPMDDAMPTSDAPPSSIPMGPTIVVTQPSPVLDRMIEGLERSAAYGPN